MLEKLIGRKFRIGRNDCYTLAVEARVLLGRKPLPKYHNYIGSSYSDVIRDGLEKMDIVRSPFDGCLVVINAEQLALGVYIGGKVLCYNSRNISDLVDLMLVPAMGYYD